MTRVVITNVFGSFNRGDALLVETLYTAIQEVFPGAELSGIAHFPELERKHLPDVEWWTPPGRSYATTRWRRRLENMWRTLATAAFVAAGAPSGLSFLDAREKFGAIMAIKNCDLVVSCAGGFLHDANASIWGNFLQLAVAHRFNKRVVVAPQTIGPMRSRVVKLVAREVLKRCAVVCAREAYTEEFLRDLKINPAPIFRTTDLALYHDRVDAKAGLAAIRSLGFAQGESFIGASVVDWSFPGSSDRGAARSKYEDDVCATLNMAYDVLGLRTLLVNQVSSDLSLARRIGARLGKVVVVDEIDRSTSEMRGLIRNAKTFFGSRFHSCVFALLEGVPTTSIAYTYKSTGIMQDLTLNDRVFDIETFDPKVVVDLMSQDLEHGERESAKIRRSLSSNPFPSFQSALRKYAGTILG